MANDLNGFMNFIKHNQFLTIFILAIVLSFAVYGNGIFGDFVFDDVTVVQNRPDIKDPGNFFNLFISPYHQNMPKTGLYRPFAMASYAVNHYINGSSVGFHVINIVIHALNSFLVFWLIDYLFKNKFLSYSTFLLFLTHPIHTEAVTSIVGRAELLAFLGSLTTIYFLSKNNKILAAIAFLFGLMSKEIAIMVLPIIFYLDLVRDKVWRKAIINNLFFIFPLILYLFLRYLALGRYFAGDITTTIVSNVLIFVSFPERVFTALKVLVLYAEKLIWPVHLSADYSYNAIPIVKNIFISLPSIAGLIILVGLVIVLIPRKMNRTSFVHAPNLSKTVMVRGFSFASAVFLFPYLMISNLVIPVGTIMGERLMYFPSLGFSVASALIIVKLLNKEKIYKIASFSLLVFLTTFYGARTLIRNKDWLDNRTLFYATVKESPNSLITRTALAGVYIRADEWDLAKEQLEIAKGIYKDSSRLQNLFGVVADHEGDLILAEEKYKRSLELNPNAIDTSINLAELYLKQGRLEEAGDNFFKVIDFYTTTEYVMRYAYIQIALNKPDKALDIINKYFSSDLDNPNNSDVGALIGTAYFVKGDYKIAIFYLKKSIELGNPSPEIKEILKLSEENLAETK